MNMISERLKKLRDDLGYNQEGIAATVGMKQRTWSDWEKKPPDALEWLLRIGQRYAISVDYLLGLTDDPTPHRNGVQSYPERGQQVIDAMRSMSEREQAAVVQITQILQDVEANARRAAMLQMLRTAMEPIQELLGAEAAEDFYQAIDLLRRTGDQSAFLSWLSAHLRDEQPGGDEE
jgi:transcriptional regulator with XRE-family HTH domain